MSGTESDPILVLGGGKIELYGNEEDAIQRGGWLASRKLGGRAKYLDAVHLFGGKMYAVEITKESEAVGLDAADVTGGLLGTGEEQ